MVKKSGKNSVPSNEKKDAVLPALPMFFREPRPLDAKRHAKAAITPGGDYGFARDTNSILVNTIEFLEAAKSYPIVFTADEKPLPAVIVGLERANYFVQEDGGWKNGHYIPAYVRQYPFLFLERPQENKFYLCIDEGSPQYSPIQGRDKLPLYTPQGKPAPITEQALQFCTAFYQHYAIARHFCDDLKKRDLLMPYHSEARLASGRKLGLSGFQMIDEKALSRLSDKDFLEFRKKGWLPFIYFALASASNWKRLADLANQA